MDHLQEKNIEFQPGHVPVSIAAKAYGKNPAWVRAGIIAGWLNIGVAIRKGKQVTDVQEMDSKKGRINYYISPKKLYEETGYLYEKNEQ
ncbi:hypothetical protein [Mediterraneibacter sp.]